MNNYMFRPVLAIFRLSLGNLRSYYKHARTWCRDVYITGLISKNKTKKQESNKNNTKENRYRKIKLLWGCARPSTPPQ